jgi:CRISPR-associated protein Csm4
MTYYKVILELISPLGTPLAADTLFGHLCWGLAMHEGDLAIGEFLAAMDSAEPPLLISDPFPRGYWPVPAIPFEYQFSSGIQADRKKLTKTDWLHEKIFQPWQKNLCWSSLPDISKSKKPEYHRTSVAHVSVNRLTSGSMDTNGLYFDEQIFVNSSENSNPEFEVYILTSLSKERIQQLFQWGLEGGYGRDSSVGLGHLIYKKIEPWSLPVTPSANALMTLGPMVPKKNDPTIGFWRLATRFGKLGGPLAMTDDETLQPFKYPLTQLKTGAVFLATGRSFLGRMVHNIHPQRPEVVQYGYALTLPIQLASSLVNALEEESVNHDS